jgi:hypothetical protein
VEQIKAANIDITLGTSIVSPDEAIEHDEYEFSLDC